MLVFFTCDGLDSYIFQIGEVEYSSHRYAVYALNIDVYIFSLDFQSIV